MGAIERINHYPPRHIVTDEERHELRLRDLTNKKWLKRRDEIASGDPVALRNVENDFLTHCADSQSGVLRNLIRTALTNPSDTTGREFLRVVKDMIQTDARIEAEAELELKPSRRPLGDSTRAALDAVGEALRGLDRK